MVTKPSSKRTVWSGGNSSPSVEFVALIVSVAFAAAGSAGGAAEVCEKDGSVKPNNRIKPSIFLITCHLLEQFKLILVSVLQNFKIFFPKRTKMSKDGTSLGARMKIYENHTNQRLMKLIPIYARVDGICFHSFCKGLNKPFDDRLSNLMIELTMDLAKEFNANCAYTQSDEISFAWNLEDYES